MLSFHLVLSFLLEDFGLLHLLYVLQLGVVGNVVEIDAKGEVPITKLLEIHQRHSPYHCFDGAMMKHALMKGFALPVTAREQCQ
jgi:hypothetical protein